MSDIKKQELIELLKNAESGSNEIDTDYFRWKHTDDETYDVMPVSTSVDAALGEINKGFGHGYYFDGKVFTFSITLEDNDGDLEILGKDSHKSLPLAILLAVVEAAT